MMQVHLQSLLLTAVKSLRPRSVGPQVYFINESTGIGRDRIRGHWGQGELLEDMSEECGGRRLDCELQKNSCRVLFTAIAPGSDT